MVVAADCMSEGHELESCLIQVGFFSLGAGSAMGPVGRPGIRSRVSSPSRTCLCVIQIHTERKTQLECTCWSTVLLFYSAVIEIVIRYSITYFYENVSLQFTSQLLLITSTSSKGVGCTLPASPQEIFEQTLVRQRQTIYPDAVYVLHSQYKLLPSGKRYTIPKCKVNRYNNNYTNGNL